MRTEAPVSVQLSDYTPYPFAVEQVDLRFDLDPDATRVRCEMRIRRTGAAGEPLVLDGESLRLLTIALDGAPLQPSGYTVEEKRLVIPSVPDDFTLTTEVVDRPEGSRRNREDGRQGRLN